MKRLKLSALNVVSLVACGLLITACATIAPSNQAATQQAVSGKAWSLTLMDKAVEPYSLHATEVDSLKQTLTADYAFAKAEPKNQMSAQQWSILIDPDHHLLGGFLNRWKTEGKLDSGFVVEEKKMVSDAFDAIIGLESGKAKP